jgi:TRAP-type C4-dicarboxylate transport system permease small subunit
MYRKITAGYSALLRWLLAIAVGILIFPVSLQIFSALHRADPRATSGTEEMARFLFVWMIMIGAMLGIHENRHFEVDVWPRLAPRPQAALRLVANVAVLGVRAGVRAGPASSSRASPGTASPSWPSCRCG